MKQIFILIFSLLSFVNLEGQTNTLYTVPGDNFLTIGDYSSTNGTKGILFTGFRDVFPTYFGASIEAVNSWLCCGGYPGSGYAGIKHIGLNFNIHNPNNFEAANDKITAMSITSQGYIGIGTSSPQYKLDVNGSTNINGNIMQSTTTGYNSFSSGVRIDVGGGCNNALFVNGDTRFGSDFTGPKTGIIKYNTNLDAFIIDTWGSGKDIRIGGAKLILGVGEGNQPGNVGIGTINPAYKLDVLGTIRAKEVLVNLDGGADFVFEKDYKLPTIEHVANYVQENKHLPDIPSATEMTKNGVSMGDMQVKLLQKVEELTLYAIEQNKSKKELEAKLSKQENQYNALLEKVEMLTKQIEKK